MPIDTSIYGMVRGPAQQPGPLDEYAKAMTLRAMIDQQGLHSLQRRQLEQTIADDDATRAAAIEARGDPVRMRDILYGKGLYKPAQAMDKAAQDRTKGDAEILNHDRQLLSDVIKESNNDLKAIRTPEQYEAYRQRMMGTASMFSTPKMQEFVRQRAAQIPAQFDPQWVQRMLADGQKLVTPEIEVRNIGGQDVPYNKNPFAGPVGPWAGGVAMNRTVSPDAALSAGVQIRAQDAPTLDSGSLQWFTKPNAGAPIPSVTGGAPIPVSPQGAPAPTPSPVPGANASYKGANPMKATTDAIAKIKAEMAQTRDPALRASLQREIDGAAAAIRMTPEQVAAIQPAVAQPSAYDTENLDARDLRLANMPNGGRPAASPAPVAAPGGSVAIRPVDANGKPVEKRENPPQGYRWSADGKSLEIIPGGPAEKMGEAQVKQMVGIRNTRDAITEYRNALKGWGVTDIANPDARAKMGTVYKNMMLQAKEAYNLGVLNGPDMEILQSVITDPASWRAGLVSKNSLDAQAKKLDEIMEKIGRTISTQTHQQGAPQATAPTATARAPTRDEIDAELRRRGIAK